MSNTIDVNKAWQIIKREKKKIFLTTGITTFIAIIYCVFATPIFTGKVIINPPKLSDASKSGFVNFVSGMVSFGGITGNFSQKSDTDIITAVLKSNTVADMVVNRFDLTKRYKKKDIELARMALKAKVSFTADTKSGFLEIDADDTEPKMARDIANYYIVALGQLINNVAYDKNIQKARFLMAQISIYKDKLIQSQESLAIFENTNGITAGRQLEIATGLSADLQFQLVTDQAQLAAMTQYVTPNNADYQKLQYTIKSLKAELEQLSKHGDYGDKLPALAGLAPKLTKQYYNLTNDVKIYTAAYNALNTLYQSAEIDALSQVDPVVIQVIDYASLPLHKSKPRRTFIVMMSFLLGICVSSGWMLLRDRSYIE